MAADMVVRATSPPGRRLIRTASSPMPGRVLADARQGVQRQQRVYLAAQARAVDQGQRPDAGGVGQRQAQGDRAAGGVAGQIQRRPGAGGGEERGHEGRQVGAGSVTVAGGAALAVTGQAQRQDPAGPGQGRDDPPPAGRALLVPVQQQQRRPGTGLQILSVHPVDRDPAIMNNDLSPGPGPGRIRSGLRQGSHRGLRVAAHPRERLLPSQGAGSGTWSRRCTPGWLNEPPPA